MTSMRTRPGGYRGATSLGKARRRNPSTVDRFGPIHFAAVNAQALASLPSILQRWLPDGRRQGLEYVALNPRRADRHPGSFKINLRSGRWSDFATGDRGGDPISLAAWLFGLSQTAAARRIAEMLGLDHD